MLDMMKTNECRHHNLLGLRLVAAVPYSFGVFRRPNSSDIASRLLKPWFKTYQVVATVAVRNLCLSPDFEMSFEFLSLSIVIFIFAYRRVI